MCLGIWAFGALLFSWMVRVAIPIMNGSLRAQPELNPRSPMHQQTHYENLHPNPRPRRPRAAGRTAAGPRRLHPPGTVAPKQSLRGVPQEGERRAFTPSGAPANTTAATSAATSATWRSPTSPTPSSTTARSFPPSSRRRTAAAATSTRSAEFNASHHAKAARILGSLDNVLAEVVEGNRGFKTPAFPNGVSAAAVNGCWQCHGAEVKITRQRQARSRHLAQHRHRPHQPRRQRRLVRRLPFAP